MQLEDERRKPRWDYIYEPDAQAVIDELLVRYVEALVYQAVAENMASEQSGAHGRDEVGVRQRRRSVIDELQLVYNKTRQAGDHQRNFRNRRRRRRGLTLNADTESRLEQSEDKR